MVAYPGGAPTGTVVVYLKLAGCQEVKREFHSPLKMRRYFRRAIAKAPKNLVEQAAKDQRINIQFRESLRQALMTRSDFEMTSSAAAFFVCLMLHDPKDGPLLMPAFTKCLRQSRYVVVSVGRSEQGLYVANVGKGIPDLAAQLRDPVLNFRPQTVH